MSSNTDVLVNAVSFSSGSLIREFNLLKKLPHVDPETNYHVLCTTDVAERLGEVGPNVVVHPVVEKENGFLQPLQTKHRIFWENVELFRWSRQINPDLLYFPSHITNLVNFTPKVVAVRNIAPFYPEAQPNRSTWESIRLRALRATTRLSVRQAERVVFFTQSTLDHVSEYVPSVVEKATVIPHGMPPGFEPVSPDFDLLNQYELPDEFLLTISNVARYKNYIELIEGYARAKDQSDEIPDLCIVGKVIDEKYGIEIEERIRSLNLEDEIHWVGFVDHDHLPHLHAASEGFLFSSGCENAPITLIEALGCGTAIACSDATSMPEICGDAANYFDPNDTEEVAENIVAIATDEEERHRLEQAARNRADTFSWSESARQTSELFEQICRD